MSWRFRQSFTIIPGLRLNLSKSGLSASIGGAPFTMNIGPHGLTETLSVPGTGLSYRHHDGFGGISHPSSSNFTPDSIDAPPAQRPFTNAAPIEEIHSASTKLLTSESLKGLKHLIQTAFHEREDISKQLSSAQRDSQAATQKFQSWDDGFLFKRLFKSAFAKRMTSMESEVAKVAELEEQLRLTTIATHIEIEKEQANFYYRLKDEFTRLCECRAIWDIKAHQATDKFHERTTANLRVNRARVTFALDRCELIQWDEKVPHMQNTKGGDFYLYPGFILYRASKEAFSVIEYHDVKGTAVVISFQEEEAIPADTKIIGQAWAKANKDGSRDRRFAENYQIPVAQYGQVTLKSDSGLWEEFQFSNPERLLDYLRAFDSFAASFAAVIH